jgi:uncharacterized protein YggE
MLFVISSFAQNEDRFIKILGNASQSFEATAMNINLTLTEVARDEYRQVRYKSIEDVTTEVNTELAKIGLSLTKNAAEVFPPQSHYNSTPQIGYNLDVDDIAQAKQVYALQVQGLKVNNYNFVFDSNLKINEDQLAFEALKDAKRKATALANEIGKKVGKVLNIEDRSSGTMRAPSNGRNNEHSVRYGITVTYELLD